jgi:hypothetical protein
MADDQPRAFPEPSPWRARVSRRQGTMWLRQDEIPRLGQEPRPSADHVRIGQPLPSSQTTASNSGPVCAVKSLRAVSRPYRDPCRANPHAISVRYCHDHCCQLLPHIGLCRASGADWMLFLHPEQKKFAERDFRGPARLPGECLEAGRHCFGASRALCSEKSTSSGTS